MSQLKAFTDNKVNVGEIMVFAYDRVENHKKKKMMLKGIFSLSSHVFKSFLVFGLLKLGVVL